MFSLTFLLFFVQYYPTTAIKCFAGEKLNPSTKATPYCLFEMTINDGFPDATQLVDNHHCEEHTFSPTVWNPSCYAEVFVNYYAKTLTIELDIIQTEDYYIEQYKNIFDDYNFTTMASKYGITGILTRPRLFSVIRMMCKTHDNCAIEQVNKFLLTELSKIDKRIEMLPKFNVTLDEPKSAKKQSNLICSDAHDKPVECNQNQNNCFMSIKPIFPASLFCTITIPSSVVFFSYALSWYDEENFFVAMTKGESDWHAFCRTDYCNNREKTQKIDRLILDFIGVPPSNDHHSHHLKDPKEKTNATNKQNIKENNPNLDIINVKLNSQNSAKSSKSCCYYLLILSSSLLVESISKRVFRFI